MHQASHFGPSAQGSLSDIANIVQHVRRVRAFGRVSLRNLDRLGIAHLYFRAGKLVHAVGNHGDASAILADIRGWSRAIVRFDRIVVAPAITLGADADQLLDAVLLHFYQRGIVSIPPPPRVIDSSLVVTHEVKQLLSPWEWQMLVEATRRVSRAVSHLVGPAEALRVLEDILDDCTEAFPAFANFKIAPGGYLHIVDRSDLDRLPRAELLEGFTALFAICQYFCSPMIGEREAHRLILLALQDLAPPLSNMGVFHVDQRLLMSRSPD